MKYNLWKNRLLLFTLSNGGFLDNYPVEKVKDVVIKYIAYLKLKYSSVLTLLREQLELSDQIIYQIHNIFQEFEREVYANPSNPQA